MNKKRFEAVHNDKDAWDIIDYKESKKINGLVIYNDLGCIYFSSAPQLCDLLNELNDECEFLEIENESLEDGATRYAKLYHESLKENEQLQQQNKKLQEKIKKERISFKKTQERYSKKVEAKIKELVKENENAKSILDDFIWILNVLQANPNDTKRLGVAKDMLQNMGVLLYEK